MRQLLIAGIISALGATPALTQTKSGPPVVGIIESSDGKSCRCPAMMGNRLIFY